MDLDIKKLDEVWTADSRKLGLAQQVHHRTEEINSALQLYGSYLEIENYDYGLDYFVPTDYVAGRDPDSERILLKVNFQSVMDRIWFRMPDFIVQGKYHKEALPAS